MKNTFAPHHRYLLHLTFVTPRLTRMNPRIAVVGGGPGGLFFATLARRRLPDAEVVLFERNASSDAFGFGVVFSDATLRKIDEADPVLRNALDEHGRHWDRIDVSSAGVWNGFGGNGMAAIHRKTLLGLLQENARQAGVEVRFSTPAPSIADLARDFDLVVGADGTNSTVRDHLGDIGQTVETATAKFIWFGTTHMFDGLTFVHRVSEHGNFAVHGYPISDALSTFIVETDEETWRAAGLDSFDVSQAPGPSDEQSQAYLEKLFAEDIAGAPLVANNSRWGNFRTRRTRTWHRENVVLLGDAVHTAHFSVGSGTKMAMEDAVVLADETAAAFRGETDLAEALETYESQRSASVAKIQDRARPSLSWWERFGLYQRSLDPLTFTFHFFSRSIGVTKMDERDPELVRRTRQAWRPSAAVADLTGARRTGRLQQLPPDAVVVQAPESDSALREVLDSLPRDGVVAVTGAAELSKVLLSEEARLRRGLTTVLVGEYDDDAAETIVLSGRADAVASAAVLR
jgi:2-polyprenyl-6-methoxyphenol hydroxylase-like FAD-dependent oxidoreductase